MTGRVNHWTRRHFCQACAATAASSRLGWAAVTPRESSGFAFVGSLSASPNPDSGSIHVFQVSGARWSAVQTLPAIAPAHLALHPVLATLYAVHAVGLCDHLPRGAVSSYSIAPATGRLTLGNTQPLSLSATYPRHAAVTADGRYLLVAAEGGGLYNLLPIASDGSLKPPAAIRKELGLFDGLVAKTAAPRQVLLHPDGATILTADPGQETVGIFSIEGDSINLLHRTRTYAGAGPSQLALSPSGDWVYSMHATDGSIAVHRFVSRKLLAPSQIHRDQQPGPTLMAMHPAGRFLVTASACALTSISIDSRSGGLSTVTAVAQQEPFRVLAFSPCGSHLIGTHASSGDVVRIPFAAASGSFGRSRIVAHVGAASSLLFHAI